MNTTQKAALLTISKAENNLGVNKGVVSRLVKQGHVPAYTNPADRRQRLVDPEQVKKALEPQPAAGGREQQDR